jgi:hypothetical protein
MLHAGWKSLSGFSRRGARRAARPLVTLAQGSAPGLFLIGLSIRKRFSTQALSKFINTLSAIALATLLYAPSAAAEAFEQAAEAYRTRNYALAFQLFSDLAEENDTRSQTVLALMYKFGEGVQEDLSDAAKWYRRAAESGYAPAQYNLGVMLAKGQGVPVDRREARRWLIAANDAGFERAAADLAAIDGDPLPLAHPERRDPVEWSKAWNLRLPVTVPRFAGRDDTITGTSGEGSSALSTHRTQPKKFTRYRVQLGSMGSEKAALRLWQILSDANPVLFDNLTREVSVGSVNGQTIFRLRASVFTSLDAAKAFCAKLTGRTETGCMALR